MEDYQIVELYWKRDQQAIRETENKYGHYLTKIALNILADLEDSKESVNDTYLKAWNSMPPHKPGILATYLGKITRQVSIDIFRKRTSKKRQPSQYALCLREAREWNTVFPDPVQEAELHTLAEAISTFLRTLSPQARNTFIGRYYFMDSIREISLYYDMSQSKVKSMLRPQNVIFSKCLSAPVYGSC